MSIINIININQVVKSVEGRDFVNITNRNHIVKSAGVQLYANRFGVKRMPRKNITVIVYLAVFKYVLK